MRGVRVVSGGAVPLDQVQPIGVGHDQVLKDHGGLEFRGGSQGFGALLQKMKHDVALRGQHPLHRLADDHLIIHEEDHGAVGGSHGRGGDGDVGHRALGNGAVIGSRWGAIGPGPRTCSEGSGRERS